MSRVGYEVKSVRAFLLPVIVMVLIAVAPQGVGADGPSVPMTPPQPPLAPVRGPLGDSPIELPRPAPAGLPPLKAVCIVGPIDGDNGTVTNEQKDAMDDAAAELTAHGVTVHKFYAPNTSWTQIAAAAQGAHFLLYRGHGVYWPPPDMPSPPVGGFCLSGDFVSNDEIRRDLHPAPGAVVMLYGCFTAGSSGNDTGAITQAEAIRRVSEYSDPFFDAGFGGYYANWIPDSFKLFARYLLTGESLGETYDSFNSSYNQSVVEKPGTHPTHPDADLWLGRNNWSYWKYCNAFVGDPDATLAGLFAGAVTVTPGELRLLSPVDGPERTLHAAVIPRPAQPLTWTATLDAVPWAVADTAHGDQTQLLAVTLDPAGLAPGVYTTTLRVDAPALAPLADGGIAVPVTLTVAATIRTVFLPDVGKGF